MTQQNCLLSLSVALTLTLLGACGGGGSGLENTATLRGTITAAPNSAIDNDTNDSTSSQIGNNNISTAQALRNPVTLGGYVETRNSDGCRGNLSGVDNNDLFSVELFEDQTIQLTVADLDTADLDLFLADSSGQVVAMSVAADSNESVRVPADGNYLVEVCAFSGASNYVMGIGQARGGFSPNSGSSQQEFIAGEAVLQWEPDADGVAVLSKALPTMQMLGSGAGFDLVKLSSGITTRASNTRQFASDEQASRYETLMQLKALNAMPGVMCAEPNFVRQASATPNDSGYQFQWHYPLIELPSAWDTTVGDASVITAVIDTGVLLSHPDLQGQFDPNDPDGYDFISDPQVAGDNNGRDDDANDPGDRSPGGSSFHGTHVAGTVAAAGNNSIGVAGVAYGSKIMPLRVLGIGGGSSFDTLQAVLYAAGLNNASGRLPPRRADVINLSLGGGGFSQAEQNAFTNARNAGVIIVAAAGNENTSRPSYPAAYDGVVSVSATDQLRRRAPYSNFGSTIDVAAPGGDAQRDRDGDGYGDGVLSTGGNDSSGSVRAVYPFEQGTSMAAPHVAGVAALMKSVFPALTPAQFDALLANGRLTDDIGSPNRDNEFGHGIINARKAVAAALELAGGAAAPTTAMLVASPSSLGFDSSQNELAVTLQNSGNGELTVNSVSDDAPWLSITASDIDSSSGLGEYTASINRSGLADGSYQATITASSSANTISIPVLLQVGVQNGDVGVQYILLVDSSTNDIVDGRRLVENNSRYNYVFRNVPPGDYEIVAGTDSDEDGIICDAGEACGGYITLDQPVVIPVDGVDLNGLDFISGFEAQLNSATAPQSFRRKDTQAGFTE